MAQNKVYTVIHLSVNLITIMYDIVRCCLFEVRITVLHCVTLCCSVTFSDLGNSLLNNPSLNIPQVE